MSLVRKILYATGAVVLLAVIIGVFLPGKIYVERERTIDAPAATVFALLSDPRRREEWSPHRQETVESIPVERVVTELDMGGNRRAISTFSLERGDAGTTVHWSIASDVGVNLIARYRGPADSSRLEAECERGLAALKSMAESLPRADFGDLPIEHLNMGPVWIAYRTTSSMPNAGAISEAMGDAYFEILSFMDRNELQEAGAPLSISRGFSGARMIFDAAIPVSGVTEEMAELADGADGVKLGQTRGGAVVRATHVGSYGTLDRTHEKIAAYLAAWGIERNGDAWESYESDPARTDESELVTYVYYPVRERAP